MTRTITHLYDDYDEATRAVSMLEDAGIAHSDISIVGHDARYAGSGTTETVEPADEAAAASTGTGAGAGASVGTVVGGGIGLLAGIGALAIPGVGPVVAAGWLIATISGAGIGAGAGGLLGSLTGAGHSEPDAHVYAEGVRRGGTLVSVRVDDSRAQQVETMLNSTGRVDLAQRGADYRAGGWDRFDESRAAAQTGMSAPLGAAGAPATSTEAIERDRMGNSTHA